MPAPKNKLSLIIAIVNSGFAETVMDVAKAEGVRGGTITHCRGTSNESLAKKYGVYVTPDKEMVWIVTRTEIVDNVLNAIHATLNNKNPNQVFVFSVPVENAVGFKLDDVDKQDNNSSEEANS